MNIPVLGVQFVQPDCKFSSICFHPRFQVALLFRIHTHSIFP